MKRENAIKCLLYCRSLWLASTVSLLICATYPSIAISQPPPPVEPIPVLDFGQSEKAISVTLTLGSSSATLDSVKVYRGRAHGRIGNPPLLGVQLLDLSNNVIDSFNAWNPRYVHVYNAEGRDSRAVLPEGTGTGSIIFPFSPNVATMDVKNKEEQDSQIVSVDLVPSIHTFCRDNRDDSDCGNVANRAPVCNAGGPYQVECGGQTTNVALNGTGPSDPDSDPLTYAWSGSFGTAIGGTPTVQFQGYGNFIVNLEVKDDFGGEASCSTNVAVVDTIPPVIRCNAPATMKPPDTPISFVATATDSCIGTTTASITGFNCFALTTKGKPIDKKESCKVAVEGDTITILDSGGIDNHITWNILTTDSSGNKASLKCEILVVQNEK